MNTGPTVRVRLREVQLTWLFEGVGVIREMQEEKNVVRDGKIALVSEAKGEVLKSLVVTHTLCVSFSLLQVTGRLRACHSLGPQTAHTQIVALPHTVSVTQTYVYIYIETDIFSKYIENK